jgi:hypothetical protein
MQSFRGYLWDDRHGGPFDRGSADSYYGRPSNPHYYVGETAASDMVVEKDMSKDDIEAYYAGYDFQEWYGDKKDWG